MDNSSERSLTRDAGLVLVLAILLNGLVFFGAWSHARLIGTFYSAFLVHAGFTLYDGRFNTLRTKTWLLLLAAWTLAEISPFFGYAVPL